VWRRSPQKRMRGFAHEQMQQRHRPVHACASSVVSHCRPWFRNELHGASTRCTTFLLYPLLWGRIAWWRGTPPHTFYRFAKIIAQSFQPKQLDTEGGRPPAGRAQLISIPSPSQLGHGVLPPWPRCCDHLPQTFPGIRGVRHAKFCKNGEAGANEARTKANAPSH
jgi:hypothetical protein